MLSNNNGSVASSKRTKTILINPKGKQKAERIQDGEKRQQKKERNVNI